MDLLRAFVRDWRTTGSAVPSSRFLQQGMLAPLDFARIGLAVELGPGTGCITRALLRSLSPQARLVAIDINPGFVHNLQQGPDRRLLALEGCARQLPDLLQAQGLGPADCVVSSLPYCNMDWKLRNQHVEAIVRALGPGGRFVVFQYSPFYMPRVLQRHFSNYRASFVPFNFPPALVYCSVKQAGP